MGKRIMWNGCNLKEVISVTGRHESAKDWTWEHFEDIVKNDGLKVFTDEGPQIVEFGSMLYKTADGIEVRKLTADEERNVVIHMTDGLELLGTVVGIVGDHIFMNYATGGSTIVSFNEIDYWEYEDESSAVITNVPKVIYLNFGDLPDGGRYDYAELDGVTFSEERIDKNDVKYVQIDAIVKDFLLNEKVDEAALEYFKRLQEETSKLPEIQAKFHAYKQIIRDVRDIIIKQLIDKTNE